jgi:hypothetical protein
VSVSTRLSDWVRRDILPRLATVRLSEIVRAIGCSKASASDIRRGKRTPHVSTWAALAALAGVDTRARGEPLRRLSSDSTIS